ncbi:MAG: septum formation initiator family protein [Levilactobacillus sp.]|jgi:cell division protein DivIC|uniref:Septum formation initiator family protein n=1 Tax=Levilactobacillus suantsaiihabitans TaxID=2487722 RepID=A0A4Z0J6L9_9LACO|nr:MULTISPECIES: septum formation initiator family protein [Levilactobacillus]MCH4124247.1 septum formation initiator family protein [Levilactobacillus sp.]MCI1554467.1 septum formation initiator family protein [Levilactobacillus sp.]MCI1599817.1 septum formation initiator family protein [Levilactobacillus sp.]MCI1605623.1 septum formation initiator family protein [Levilactobacillus sp.]TGD18202.1 septum formation initiator family protein [Levilactobacillus suantsaiihabitans]
MADAKPTAKIQRLENDYTRKLDHQQAVVHHHHWLGHRRMRRATRILVVFAVFAVILGVQLIRSHASLHQVDQQVTTSKQRLAKSQAKNADLKLEIKQLNDKDYLGQLIRSKYYYSKTGETIYSLPGDHASDVTAK